jgi:putative aldouronate transport system substrate-binding protein
MKKAIFASIAIVFLLLAGSLFAGGQQSAPVASSGDPAPTGTVNYPIKTDVTLKYWVALSPKLNTTFVSNADTPFGKYLTEKTGIKIEWIHPPTNASKEQFNLMNSIR